jgi:multidrug efflux pump subunit AcrA (membrane-fusion protein)
MVLSLAVAGSVFAILWWSGTKASSDDQVRPTPTDEVVQLAGPRSIRVRPGTPLDDKLQIVEVASAWLTAPVLPVTGTTLASLRPGKEAAQDAWQFATPDLLTAFSDWQKAVKDIQFQETQLKAVRDLNESRIDAQKKVVARMEKLVAAGTDTPKDLAVERTNLIQFEIQARKDIHDAEQTVFLARRTEATLARQLQQAGLEPTMLRSAAAQGDIVVAEVPERVMSRVKLGMTCEVRFFALPDRVFTGKVSSISPVISKEKRVLNVQFTVKDPDNLVRPGMFAEIGVGTDRRRALLMPADGVLHIGTRDYALLEIEPSIWQIAEVETGELRGTNVEVLAGLKAGNRVLGKGAILLKPVVVRALQALASEPARVLADTERGGKR